jgi:hypothetical protein
MNSVNFLKKKELTDKPFNYILKKKVNVYAYIYIYDTKPLGYSKKLTDRMNFQGRK